MEENKNIVTQILNQYFKGSLASMASLFGVSPMAVRKWQELGEFPAKHGRMQQAHELTGIDYKKLTPSAYQAPDGFSQRLQQFQLAA
ncbi:hypothetical protein [Vibrio aestuarianus]|uniref:Uncharacterized protein n=1 Tax=Vibrio aestuarianus TaxID=28171 RepID=A0ABD7YQ55_9VIBR|nr:hypothetical protein [Vibrio aestuarianus]WGK87233.1 hypothetical protein PYE67_14005 [Vibrio aestuarianus]CAH8235456.1 conserved hypothetical protein [Vibrio aestuarianus]